MLDGQHSVPSNLLESMSCTNEEAVLWQRGEAWVHDARHEALHQSISSMHMAVGKGCYLQCACLQHKQL